VIGYPSEESYAGSHRENLKMIRATRWMWDQPLPQWPIPGLEPWQPLSIVWIFLVPYAAAMSSSKAAASTGLMSNGDSMLSIAGRSTEST
jgi:hypothetical protein